MTIMSDERDMQTRTSIPPNGRLKPLFEFIFERAPGGLIMVNSDGIIVLANGRAEEIFGYTKTELLGRTVESLVPEPSRKLHSQYRKEFSRTPENRRMGAGRDLYGLRKDGSLVPIEVGLTTIETAEGTFVLSSVLDITERKRKEAEFLDAQRRLRLALETSKIGFWEWNVIEGTVRWDEQMFEMYGVTPTPDGMVPYSTWREAVLSEDLEKQERILQETIANKGQSKREFRIQRRNDAEPRHIEAVETTRLNAKGDTEWVIGTNLDVTERHRSEMRLREQSYRQKLFIDEAPAAIALFDRDMRYMAVSKRWLSDFGLEEQNVIGRSHYEVFPEIPERWKAIHRRCLAGAIETCADDPFVRADGTTQWLRWEVHPWRQGSNDDIGGIAIFCEDITSRKKTEEKLHQAEFQYKLVTDSLPVLISYIDRDLRYRMVNAMYRRWFGLENVEVSGKRVDEVLGTAAFDAIRPALEQALSGQSVSFDKLIPYKAAGLRHIHANYIPDVAEDGTVRGLFVLVEDITQQKIAELAIRESETRFRAIYEHAPIGIIQIDINSDRLLEVNHHLCSILGLSREKLLLKHLSDIMQTKDVLSEQRRNGMYETREFEADFRRFDGVSIPVRVISSVIEGDLGSRYRLLLVEDMTERKRADQERLMLDEERLARKQAEQINQIKDQFLATLSHELRAPLHAILGWTQLLKRKRGDPAHLERALAVIEQNATAQANLISDLLDINRIASGKLRLNFERTAIAPLVSSAVESMLPAANEKHIQLESKIEDGLPSIQADEKRLRQCLLNLLTNAIKFTPEHGRIVVNAISAGTQVEISVRDTGQGIRPEFLPLIFERFQQASSSSARIHGGLGLGLAIVKHLVELHGGTISVESKGEGQGSVFTLSLPRDNEKIEKPPVSSDAVITDAHRFSGSTILVVDDDLNAQEILRGLLEDYGAKVITAGSAEKGLEVINTRKIDLVISDLGMPNHDGYYFLKEIRKLQSDCKDVPAIALTGFALETDRQISFDAGFAKHLSKPVDPRELFASINELLGAPHRGEPHVQKVA